MLALHLLLILTPPAALLLTAPRLGASPRRALAGLLWGALVASSATLGVSHLLASRAPAWIAPNPLWTLALAPLIEETCKGAPALLPPPRDRRAATLLTGACLGVGFAATENLVATLTILGVDAAAAPALLLSRTLLPTTMHAACSAGLALSARRHPGPLGAARALACAATLHALYNTAALLSPPLCAAALLPPLAWATWLLRRASPDPTPVTPQDDAQDDAQDETQGETQNDAPRDAQPDAGRS